MVEKEEAQDEEDRQSRGYKYISFFAELKIFIVVVFIVVVVVVVSDVALVKISAHP